jgi:3',5'-nucleoside bisphosphate phosphatase
MTEKYDLHCHSNVSDGVLSPTELVQRAHEHGVTALALTDHDTTAGVVEAKEAAAQTGVKLIAGIELSASWKDKTFHIVGLGIDPDYPPLLEATRHLQVIRLERAGQIAAKLEKNAFLELLRQLLKQQRTA